MAVKFEYPPGATPLDPDDAAGLIPSHITTQGQLNEWEFQNVAEARAWAFSRKRRDFLTTRFAQELHRRMFGGTWKWAGTLRKKETVPGIDPRNIAVELKKLFDDVMYQLQHKSMPLDEIAARFHHRLTYIHPFPNGNGRHARDGRYSAHDEWSRTFRLGGTVISSHQKTRASATSRRFEQRTAAILCHY